ncbi:WASH complex subunit 3-like [Ornithodoros turicata]|uniref:WASH complex subunit 3-like n=1 Tax=Ornithodoros turicata TaxID=34597 RepID=UPI00313A0745
MKGRGFSFARKAQTPVDGDLEKLITSAVEAAVSKLRDEISPLIALVTSLFPTLSEAVLSDGPKVPSSPSADTGVHPPPPAPVTPHPVAIPPPLSLPDCTVADSMMDDDDVPSTSKRGASPSPPLCSASVGKRNRNNIKNCSKNGDNHDHKNGSQNDSKTRGKTGVCDVLAAAVAQSILGDE